MDRTFIGGIKGIDPNLQYNREKAHGQTGGIIGLIHDFNNQVTVSSYIFHAFQTCDDSKKDEEMDNVMNFIRNFKSYEEWFAKYKINQESNPELFADDVRPYIETVNEIIDDIKQLGIEIGAIYQTDKKSAKVLEKLDQISCRMSIIRNIVAPEIGKIISEYSYENKLTSNPLTLKMLEESTLTDTEAVERVKKRLVHAVSVLKDGPLPNSFSYIRRDGTILPIGWEPDL